MHSVGFEMSRVHDVVPLIYVDGVVEADCTLAEYRF